ESLANQKLMYENKVANIESKIAKKNDKIAEGKLDKDKTAEAQQDLKEWAIEKQIAQNDLDRVNLTIEKGMLNKSERTTFKDKEDALKEELKSVKAGGKSVGSDNQKEPGAVDAKVDDSNE